ncbi:Transcription elongation factor GreA [Planctomycetes bacterium Poly30]|uniref:Transcription elongation factor GreA n=1 Tax=Saltatorellus ferox TaxID=2528018 RepID=A0A518ET48_9BACT|nr:Transcription elongation factor GreA [Planctomycetes bacterium Poly30]
MSLPLLATKEMWQEFDDAWAELRQSGGPIDELLPAVKLAGEKKRAGRLVPQAKEHATTLIEAGRADDAALILGSTLAAGGNPGELVNELIEASTKAWGDKKWYPVFQEATGFKQGASDLRKPWRKFAKLVAFQPGSTLFHPGGWGVGEVLEMDIDKETLRVKFWNGRTDNFPLSAAMDIFDPLGEGDLRARALKDPEALKKEVKADPIEALNAILTRHNGRATTTTIKTAMMQIGIEGSAWSAWWRKARKLAENSDEIEVSGTPQKSLVTQLLVKTDPGEGLRRILQRSTNLSEVHQRVRDLFVGQGVEENLEQIAIEELENAAKLETEPLPERLAAWLFLREKTGQSPKLMRKVLYEVLQAPEPPDVSQPPEIWKLFQALPGAKDQERSVSILPELFGSGGAKLALEVVDAELAEANATIDAIGTEEGAEADAALAAEEAAASSDDSDDDGASADESGDDSAEAAAESEDDGTWVEEVLPHLQHAAPGQVRPLVERLLTAGREEDLRNHYSGLLARPLRNPTLMIVLADKFEDCEVHEDMPTPVQRGQALLALAQNTFRERRGNPQLTRISGRLTDFLTKGSQPILKRLFAAADISALRSANVTASRGVDSEIDNLITEIALSKDRQFFAQDGGFFWQGSTIWTTRAGLRRRSGELKEIREVKIPENQDAIGRAASFGDLSENSEWEAAIEEQRNLTARAMEMEEELRSTDLIEEAAMIEDTVCPGTRVTYSDNGSGETSTVLILGPWDSDQVLGTQVISYRAPLAQGLLGLGKGEKAQVKLPGGEIELTIESIETPDLSMIGAS